MVGITYNGSSDGRLGVTVVDANDGGGGGDGQETAMPGGPVVVTGIDDRRIEESAW
jgi:hypothetical protein